MEDYIIKQLEEMMEQIEKFTEGSTGINDEFKQQMVQAHLRIIDISLESLHSMRVQKKMNNDGTDSPEESTG